MSNRIAALNVTERKMVAASLEIDGRTARAAEAVVSGHVSEFTYARNEAGTAYVPQSPKAIALEGLKAELEAEIARVGVDALVEAPRTSRRPATPITEGVKAQGGRENYSVQIPCPSCDLTGRSGAQCCGRCAGAGHLWTKPADPIRAAADAAHMAHLRALANEGTTPEEQTARREAFTAANDAVLKAEAEKAAYRAAGARRRVRLEGSIVGNPGPALAALPEAKRRALGALIEDLEDFEDPEDLERAVALAVHGSDDLRVVQIIGGARYAATPEQEQHARAVLADLVALIAEVGRDGAELTLRPPRPATTEAEREAAGLVRLMADIEADATAEIEDQVAAFAATLDTLTAPKTESDARVFPLRMAEASGRADLVAMLCDACFGTKARVADCFRCEGHGLVWLTPAALEAKARSIEERRAAPVTDPADLDDDAPAPDRARIWDEAADAYRRALRMTVPFPLVNPYYAAPVAE